MVKFGEWLPDQPQAENALSNAYNVVPYAGHYNSFSTPSVVTSSAVSGTAVGGYSSRLVAGNSKTYVGTTTKLYERNGEGWTDISHAAGDYTLTVGTHRWEFTQWGNDIYAVSLNGIIQRQTAGTGVFADVSGGPTAACVGNVRQWVVVGDVDESGTMIPYRLRWSAIGDPTDWTISAATQCGSQDLDAKDGRIMAIKGGEFGIVFQQGAITRMQYIGAPIVWQFDKIDSRNGCEIPGSVVAVGRDVYFLSHDGFRVTDGSGESVSISYGKTSQWFHRYLYDTNKHQVTGAFDPDQRVIIWSFPTGAGENDMMLMYSIDTKRWSSAGYGCDLLWNGASSSVTLEGLDAYSTSLDALPAALDSDFWIGGQPFFMGMQSGYLATLTGTPGTAILLTTEFEINPGSRTFISAVEPVIDVACTVSIQYRNLPTESTARTVGVAPHSRTGVASFRHSSRWQALRFDITGEFTNAVGFNVVATSAGVQ